MEITSVGRSSEEAVAGLDPSWRGLYKAGGVSGVLVGILFIINIVLLFTTPQAPSSGGAATLQYIASKLKGVFPKGVAYFGIVTGALGIISAFGIIVRPIAVPPPLGIGYTVYAFFLTIWFVAVGLKLYRLG